MASKNIIGDLNKDEKLDDKNYNIKQTKIHYILEEQEVLEAINHAMIVLDEENKQQSYSVDFDNVSFPTKLYGNFIYPAGEYEAILISLGEAKGANWWCVLFPPLCFLDFSNSEAVQAAEPEDSKTNDKEKTDEKLAALVVDEEEDSLQLSDASDDDYLFKSKTSRRQPRANRDSSGRNANRTVRSKRPRFFSDDYEDGDEEDEISARDTDEGSDDEDFLSLKRKRLIISKRLNLTLSAMAKSRQTAVDERLPVKIPCRRHRGRNHSDNHMTYKHVYLCSDHSVPRALRINQRIQTNAIAQPLIPV